MYQYNVRQVELFVTLLHLFQRKKKSSVYTYGGRFCISRKNTPIFFDTDRHAVAYQISAATNIRLNPSIENTHLTVFCTQIYRFNYREKTVRTFFVCFVVLLPLNPFYNFIY